MNPWIIVGFLVALIAVGAGGYMKGETDGRTSEHNQWETREAAINADAAIKIAAADAKVAAAEHALSVNLNAVDTIYQGKLKEKDNALAVARTDAHAHGLFVDAICPASTGNTAGSITAAAGLGYGATHARLPDALADAVLAIGADADKVVEQLTACQAVVIADRKR